MQLDKTVSRSPLTKFANADSNFGDMDAEHIAQLLSCASDIVLIVDSNGLIQDAAFGEAVGIDVNAGDWIGRKFSDIVTKECETKVQDIIGNALAGRSVRPREINHLLASGKELPVRYSASKLNNTGSVIVFGQDISSISMLQQKLMNSQLSIEREFARLRAGESRYRMIFQLGDVPQIVVDAATLRVCDVNPAALKVLGREHRRVDDVKVTSLFEGGNSELLGKLLRAAVDDSAAEDIKTVLRGGEEITLAVSHFRQEQRNYLLLRLSSDSGNVVAFAKAADRKRLTVLDNMPDAFVITNASRQIISANNSFVELLNLSSASEAEGQLIDKWFERPNVDFNVLMANLREHGLVRRFATVLRTNYEQLENVEIAAIQIEHHDESVFGFVLRPMSAALAASDVDGQSISRSDEQIASLVGHMPLKDIVRETTEVIEKLCIETALDLTKENRALAAQMLGLSRQSLYAKMGKSKPEED